MTVREYDPLVISDGVERFVYPWLRAMGLPGCFPHETFVAYPRWLVACWRAASDYGHLLPSEFQPHADLWRRFLLMLSRTPYLTRSIDTVSRLGSRDATREFIVPQLFRFDAATQQTPVLDDLKRLNERRASRMNGRGHGTPRAPDAAYAAEAARGYPLSKREIARLSGHPRKG